MLIVRSYVIFKLTTHSHLTYSYLIAASNVYEISHHVYKISHHVYEISHLYEISYSTTKLVILLRNQTLYYEISHCINEIDCFYEAYEC